jgi:hypothetical protein
MGSIHLAISQIKLDQEEPLLIFIHSGLRQYKLRARSLHERNQWYKALLNYPKAGEKNFNYEDQMTVLENLYNELNISLDIGNFFT